MESLAPRRWRDCTAIRTIVDGLRASSSIKTRCGSARLPRQGGPRERNENLYRTAPRRSAAHAAAHPISTRGCLCPSPAAAPSPGVTRPPSTFQKSVLERTNPAPAPIPAPRLVQPSPSPVSQAGVTASTGAALGFEFAVLFFMVAFFFRYVIPHFRSPIAASSRPATPQGFIPPPLPASPSSQSLGDLTWDEFELLVGELYRRDGFAVEISNATGSDGGIDLVLRRDSARFIVQCKHWKSVKVTVKDIREFFGVLVSESATRGIFVTTTSFTRDAIQFAVGKPLDLIDGSTLDTLIARHPDLLDVSSWSRAFKSGATVKDPMCPSCSSSMVMRSGRHGTFWGCATYPKCRGKRETRKHICRASDGR